MNVIRKVLFILLIANLIRIIPGCCDCDEPVIYFNFNKSGITNLDNSGAYAVSTASDTMPAAAIAFEVALYDSAGYWYYAAAPKLNFHGFSNAMAMSCDCSIPMMANAHPEKINITTLFPVTSAIQAGSEVSSLFVARPTGNYAPVNSVYITLESLCRQTVGKVYNDSGAESFALFLKQEVEYDSARFAISIALSDQRVIRDTTSLIHIRRR